MKKIYLTFLISVCALALSLSTFAQGDNCAAAVQVTGTGSYSADGPSTGAGCYNCASSTNADWYYFTAPGDGTIDISSCNGGGDTRLFVYDGSCGALNQIATNDDFCDLGNGSTWASSLTGIPVTSGTTYYIEWDDRWETTSFNWEFVYTPPPPNDAAVSALLSPSTNCGLTSSETISATIHNNGTTTITTVDVNFSIDGNISGIETVIATILPGATYDYTFTATGDLSAAGAHSVNVWAILSGDGDSSNDTLRTTINNLSTVSTFPYMEDFDGNGGQLVQSTNDDIDWTPLSGPTGSTGTGPSGDVTSGQNGNGNYFYIEASTPNFPDIQADFESPCLDISGLTLPYLEFNYHMYGIAMGSLTVEIYNGSTWDSVWTLAGDQGDQWHKALIDLSTYSGTIKYRFSGITGPNWESDIAVDDILVHDKPAGVDLSVTQIINPGNFQDFCQNSSDTLWVNVFNCGTTTLSSFDINYNRGNGGLVANTVSATLAPGESAVVAVDELDFPTLGLDSILVWINNTSDVDHSNDTAGYNFFNVVSPSPANLGSDTTLCDGNSISLYPGNFNNYIWNDSSTFSSLFVDSAGTYSVETWDFSGCYDSDTIVVSFIPSPSVDLGMDTALCVTESILFDAGAGLTYAWHDGSSNQTFTVTSTTAVDSLIVVSVTDGNGCGDSDDVWVSFLDNVSIDLGNDTSICEGTTLFLSAFVQDATYQWNTGATTSFLAVDSAGNYSVTVTKCGTHIDDINVSITPSPIVDLGADQTVCYDDTVALDAQNGHLFWWSNGDSTQIANISSYCQYGLQLFDTWGDGWNGAEFKVVQNGDTIGRYTFFGGNYDSTIVQIPIGDYEIHYTSGGFPAEESYIFLSPNGDTLLMDGTSPTNGLVYTGTANCGATTITTWVDVQDTITGCFAADMVNITFVAPVINLGPDAALCPGETLTLNAGTGHSSILWSDGSTNQTLDVNAAGTYYVDVTDSLGCMVTDTVMITLASNPTVDLGPDTSFCNGSFVTLDAGAGFVNYFWSDSVVAQQNNVYGSGNYAVTVTDINGCTASDDVNVTAVTVTATISTNDATCGNADGDATVVATGGTTNYSYMWNNGTTTDLNTGLMAGTISVTVTDAMNCMVTESAQIANSDGPQVTISITDVSCNGGSDGAAIASTAGGTNPYTYVWSNAAPTNNNTGLTAGTYSVTVIDATTCPGYATAVIGEPTMFLVSVSQSDVSCNGGSDGSIDNLPFGGTSPYSFAWASGENTEDLSNLAAGIYNFTATDGNGCSLADVTVILSEPSAISVSTTSTQEICNDSNGTATVTVMNGTAPYSYLWEDGQMTTTATGLTDGTLSVTVTDDNGCTAMATATITEPTALVASISTSDATCGNADGSATASISGGLTPYNYNWSNGGVDPLNGNIAAGNYGLTVTDGNGCMITETASVVNSNGPQVSFTSTAISCNGDMDGTITANVSSGSAPYVFVWNNGGTTGNISGLGDGTYNVTVTDASGCIGSGSVNLTEPDLLIVLTTVTDATTAGGNGSIETEAMGGTSPYTYLWSDSSTNNDLTAVAGGYSLTVTDFAGCTSTVADSITDGPLGINDISVNSMEIFPNPNNGTFVLNLVNFEMNNMIDVSITNAVGQVVYQSAVQKSTTEVSINQPSGVYFIQLNDGEKTNTMRFIIK